MNTFPVKCSSIKHIILLILTLVSLQLVAQHEVPESVRGILNLKNTDLSSEKIPMNGEWSFFDNNFYNAQECKRAQKNFVQFPALFNTLRESSEGIGYGTYYLQLILPDGLEDPAFELPQIYNAYALWVNDKLVASNGSIGKSRDESKPQWLPQSVAFQKTSDTLHIVLQVSNFYHSLGGVKNPIYVGSAKKLIKNSEIARTSSMIESITLILLFLVALISQLGQKEKKRIINYFGLLCLSWAIRAAFSNLYVANHLIPDINWTLAVRIEYITLFFTMIWAILFLGRIFPNEENKIIKYLLVTGNSFFIAFAILTPPLSFTKGLTIYLIFCGIVLAYGAYVIVRALIYERAGVWYLVASSLLAIIIFTLDISAYKGVFEFKPILFSVGYQVMFLLMGVALLMHLQIFKSSKSANMLTFDDLYKNQ